MNPFLFLEKGSLWGLLLFFIFLLVLALGNFSKLFLAKHARTHRLFGASLFLWLFLGVLVISPRSLFNFLFNFIRIGGPSISSTTFLQNNNNIDQLFWLFYDIVLGCLGILTTLSAAHDFPHKKVQNEEGQSGTLMKSATVTYGEMIEHSFYQFLNLWQAIYLHFFNLYSSSSTSSSSSSSEVTSSFSLFSWDSAGRVLALFLVTSPWLFRHKFPVNSFSSNWKKASEKQKEKGKMELLLYQIKKWQYLFYKHVIFHGLNISFMLLSLRKPQQTGIPLSHSWRIFWVALNLSYVMEFFLQTLVRRSYLEQINMLRFQRLLMFASSLAAVAAIWDQVHPGVCVASLILNLSNRRHDVLNSMLIGIVGLVLNNVFS